MVCLCKSCVFNFVQMVVTTYILHINKCFFLIFTLDIYPGYVFIFSAEKGVLKTILYYAYYFKVVSNQLI